MEETAGSFWAWAITQGGLAIALWLAVLACKKLIAVIEAKDARIEVLQKNLDKVREEQVTDARADVKEQVEQQGEALAIQTQTLKMLEKLDTRLERKNGG